MNPDNSNNGFAIWGIDQAAYGPVELPALVSWIKDERVLADTWVFGQRDNCWKRAAEIPELQMFFRAKAIPTASEEPPATQPSIRIGILRRVKILGGLSDAQLERFAQAMEMQRVAQWAQVVKQGERGDAMFFILEGELRARMVQGGKETILSTLGPGDFFGDISLFDHGPRSADVVANTESTVLKMSATSLEKLAKEVPEVATPFLLATIRTLAARIRADNKRIGDSAKLSRAAEI
jgi:CRP/FNR family transcriptional regulator, cyclic AMP receptor protein